MSDDLPGAFKKGDPHAAAAGRAGALKREENKKKGTPPAAGAGRGKDAAPKGRGGFGAQVRTVSSSARKRITALVGTGIVLADETLAKGVATWAEDKLGGDEVKMLTDAIVGTLLKYPKVARRMEQAAVASELAAIPTALLLIALPRLVKHGLVPKTLSSTVGPLLDGSQEIQNAGQLLEERVQAAADERDEGEPPQPAPAPEAPPPPAAPAPLEASEPVPPKPLEIVRPAELVTPAPGQKFRPPPGLS